MTTASRKSCVLVPTIVLIAALIACRGAVGAPGITAAPDAQSILDAAGVKGGLVVHLGCGDGKLTAALWAGDRYVVHGLDADANNVEKARRHVQSLGLYGKVSVEHWTGDRLPYVDNLVNLVVVEDPGKVPIDELIRVLVPRGVAYVKAGDTWTKAVKPWPKDIDEWTHYLHGPDNNAVAGDRRVGSPGHLQWQAGPKRTRDHDALASFSAMTSSRGRLFYIIDEGPTSMIHRPAQWRLIARDAFNGKLLWKRTIDSWVTHLRYFRSGPVQLPRRLVSVGERVYATLGLDAPVSALDAATGRTLRTYDGTGSAEEFICHDGVLLVVVGDPHLWNRQAPEVDNYWEFYADAQPQGGKSIAALDAQTGKQLWSKSASNLAYLVPLSLVAGNDQAFYLDNRDLHCLDLQSGKQQWTAPFATKGLFLRNYTPTVVLYEDTIICLSLDRLAVFSVKDGRRLWENKGYAGFASPGDLFVIDDVVWTFPGVQAIRVKPQDVPGGGKEFLGFDLRTGRVTKSFSKSEVWPGGHHHRCYRNKATERFVICGRRGLEFVDLEAGDHVINWWVRGVCQYGIMPCNGLIYAPPTPCQCFNLIKLDGFHALAARNSPDTIRPADADRLQPGPAYGTLSGTRPAAVVPQGAGRPADEARAWGPPVANAKPDEWPTYRHDVSRSGCSAMGVPAELHKQWEADVGGRPSSVVVAAGRLFVSSIDCHTLRCLDAASGEPVWRFFAGGRIDSPPTIFDGMAVFGSSDGAVYAVRVDDGQLIWCFRGAPVDRRIMVSDRLESVWPIHGSVLVHRGVVYFAAGRSSFLDGGIRLYGLDAWTGKLLYQAAVRSEPTDTGGALPDVLASDGKLIHMRQVLYDASLVRQDGMRLSTIVANTGLLEDIWAHRQNWSLGTPGPIAPNAIALATRDPRQPFGKLIVYNDSVACGAQNLYTFQKHDSSKWPSTHTGHLHQKYARYTPGQFPIGTRLFAQENKAHGPSGKAAAKKLTGKSGFVSTAQHKWTLDTPLQIRAMVMAGDELFVAGWQDAVKLPQHDPADEAKAVLWRLGVTDGKRRNEYPLDAQPVFDGMAAAGGRLYLSLKNGTVLCMGPGH